MKNHTVSIILPSKFAIGIIFEMAEFTFTPYLAAKKVLRDF